MSAPNSARLRIIFLEDEPKDFSLVRHHLTQAGLSCDLVRVASHPQFVEELSKSTDVILSDHHLPEFDGFAALKLARASHPDIPFIFVTGSVSASEQQEAQRLGAHQVVLKSNLESLAATINRATDAAAERTRRRLAEEALRHSEDRYRRLIELLPCGVVVHRDGKVILANPSAARLVGVEDSDELLGRDIATFAAPEYRDLVLKRIESVKHGTPVPFVEEKLVRDDGSLVDVEVAATPVVLPDAPGEVAVMVVAKDNAERRRAREQIERLNAELEERVRQRTADLENAVRELEAFSYSVSHDLRAPLRHIDGFAELLRSTARDRLDPSSKEYLNIITESALEMGRLIEALLTFSRLSRAALNTQPVDLAQLLQGILHDLQFETEGRPIEWSIGNLPEVHGDPTLLRQTFFNLLSNAIKYTRNRSPAIIEVGATHTPAEHIVYVRDNGVGFDMEFAGKLFGVFQRLHPSADFEGIGIGLANVRRIIQRHGGRTWAQSAPDQGATFYVALPRVAGSEIPPNGPIPSLP